MSVEAVKALATSVVGETATSFRARVGSAYDRPLASSEHWCLFGDLLVVAHPERPPIVVHPDGRAEEVKFQ